MTEPGGAGTGGTEAGRALLTRWDNEIGLMNRDDFEQDILAIEAEATRAARLVDDELFQLLSDHLGGFHGECHCLRKLDERIGDEA